MTQHWESNWLNIESLIGSTSRVKLAQHRESNWLNNESQVDSTLRVKLTQHWESNWLNIENPIDSNILQLLILPGRIIILPVTQLLRLNFSSVSDSLFRSKWLNFFYRCTERKIESFFLKSDFENDFKIIWFSMWFWFRFSNHHFQNDFEFDFKSPLFRWFDFDFKIINIWWFCPSL